MGQLVLYTSNMNTVLGLLVVGMLSIEKGRAKQHLIETADNDGRAKQYLIEIADNDGQGDTKGTATSPNFPSNYPNDINNETTPIEVKQGCLIEIEFTHMDTEKGYDTVNIVDGDGEMLIPKNQTSGNKLPENVISRTNKVNVVFHSNWQFTGKGFSLKWHENCTKSTQTNKTETRKAHEATIFSNNFPKNYNKNADEVTTLEMNIGSTIRIEFEAFNISDGDLVTIVDGSGKVLLNRSGAILPEPIMSETNRATVTFISDQDGESQGFSLIYKEEFPKEEDKNELKSGVVTSKNFPKKYNKLSHEYTYIEVNNGSTIFIEFTEMKIDLYGDFVSITDGIGKLLLNTTGEIVPKPILSHTNRVYVYFSSDKDLEFEGYSFNWREIRPVIKEISGRVMSPNFPQNYTNHARQVTPILVKEGHRIEIEFKLFKIEEDKKGCNFDYVSIIDGDGKVLLDKSCGKIENVPKSVISKTNQVTIIFISDENVVDGGFYLTWKEISDTNHRTTQTIKTIENTKNVPLTISQTNTWENGNVTCSNIPGFYREITELTVNKWDKILIQINKINIDVEKEKLLVTDGNGKILFNSSSNTIPEPFVSETNHVSILFESNSRGSEKAFLLTYNGIKSGFVNSPNYPQDWHQRQDYQVEIKVREGNTISMKFLDLDIPDSENCEHHLVSVKDMNGAELLPQEDGCGNNKPEIKVSETNTVHVIYYSDRNHIRRGFRIYWRENLKSLIIPVTIPTMSSTTTTTEIPETTTRIPEINTEVPDTTADIQKTTTNILDTTTMMLDITTNIPETTPGIPKTTPDTPETTRDFMKTTTEISNTTTEIQKTSTEIKETTTQLAKSTTKISEATPGISKTTKDIPKTTTENPNNKVDIQNTTGISETKTRIPKSTTKIPGTTTVIPETTTQTPEKSTEFAETTTEIQKSTSQILKVTTNIPITIVTTRFPEKFNTTTTIPIISTTTPMLQTSTKTSITLTSTITSIPLTSTKTSIPPMSITTPITTMSAPTTSTKTSKPPSTMTNSIPPTLTATLLPSTTTSKTTSIPPLTTTNSLPPISKATSIPSTSTTTTSKPSTSTTTSIPPSAITNAVPPTSTATLPPSTTTSKTSISATTSIPQSATTNSILLTSTDTSIPSISTTTSKLSTSTTTSIHPSTTTNSLLPISKATSISSTSTTTTSKPSTSTTTLLTSKTTSITQTSTTTSVPSISTTNPIPQTSIPPPTSTPLTPKIPPSIINIHFNFNFNVYSGCGSNCNSGPFNCNCKDVSPCICNRKCNATTNITPSTTDKQITVGPQETLPIIQETTTKIPETTTETITTAFTTETITTEATIETTTAETTTEIEPKVSTKVTMQSPGYPRPEQNYTETSHTVTGRI